MFGKQNNPLNFNVAEMRKDLGWLSLLLLPCLVFGTSGCRVPGQRSFTNHEPSFDRLLEIERSQTSQTQRNSFSQGKRPGRNSQSMPISLASQDQIQLDEIQLSEESSPEQKILLNTQIALEKRAKSTTATRSISDFTDEQAQDNAEVDDVIAYKMSDAGTLEPARVEALLSKALQSKARQPKASAARDIAPSDTASNAFKPSPESSRRPDRLEEPAVRSASHEGDARRYNEDDGAIDSQSRREMDASDLTWEDHLRAAIVDLEAKTDTSLSPEIRLRQAAITRLLNVATGELEAAMQPIDGLQPHEQDYFHHQFQALSDSIDPEGNPVSSRRWSLAMLSQRKAMEHLAAVSNLEVNNTAFCTEVESYGVVNKFPDYKFKADQELLLYCELDNFVSESVKTGYETQLQGSYEIVDSNGRRLADQLLPMDSHICRNRRRDYFIAYRMYMPQNVNAGNYTLKLTIEDMKGRKFGQAELDFQIVD